MSLIQRFDLVERVRRAFGLTQKGFGATISDELVPVVILEDLSGPSIDEGYPRLCFGQDSLAQSVGEFSEIFLVNPPEARTDVIVQEILALTPTAVQEVYLITGTHDLLVGTIAAGTYGIFMNLDQRTNLRPTAYGLRRQQAATIGSIRTKLPSPSTTIFERYPLQLTIPPGHFISVATITNDKALRVAWFFYERLRSTT